VRPLLEEGTYLARRWDAECGANLYHVLDAGRGFFVEVVIDGDQEYILVLRSFSHSVPLEDYAHYVQSPGA
jgi:hypothetical protein